MRPRENYSRNWTCSGKPVDGTRGKLVGRLPLASVDNWIFNNDTPIMGALTEFTRMAPDVSLEMHSLAPDDIEIAVQDGQIVLGVGVFHRHKPGLVYESLGFERIGLYCSNNHPLFDANTVEDVEALLAQANFCKRSYLNEDFVAPVSRGLRSNASAHQIEGIAMLVLTGGYIGYLPEGFADVWVREGRMRSVGDGMFDLKSEIKLVRKRGEEPNLVTKTFIQLMKAAAVQQYSCVTPTNEIERKEPLRHMPRNISQMRRDQVSMKPTRLKTALS